MEALEMLKLPFFVPKAEQWTQTMMVTNASPKNIVDDVPATLALKQSLVQKERKFVSALFLSLSNQNASPPSCPLFPFFTGVKDACSKENVVLLKKKIDFETGTSLSLPRWQPALLTFLVKQLVFAATRPQCRGLALRLHQSV
jgi:hypothetical protein